MNRNRIGDVAELEATLYYLSQGYEVFPNTASSGPIDLILVDTDTGSTRYIDIKSITEKNRREDGTFYMRSPTPLQQKLGVELVGFLNGKPVETYRKD